MDVISIKLGEIEGGKVLDVGTQEGHFVQVLKKNLNTYSKIVGIDIDKQAIAKARNSLDDSDVIFLVMNAEQLGFENESFDTVNISASLHHIANIPQVLDEMKRVLKPGGCFIIVEMHEDGTTEAELTSVYLHQWVAEVDSALGHLHNKTLARQEFVSYITTLELSNVEYYDYHDKDTDPMETTRIEHLEDLIERTIQRAERTSNYAKLKERGNDLRQRLHAVGAQREPILSVVGKK